MPQLYTCPPTVVMLKTAILLSGSGRRAQRLRVSSDPACPPPHLYTAQQVGVSIIRGGSCWCTRPAHVSVSLQPLAARRSPLKKRRIACQTPPVDQLTHPPTEMTNDFVKTG